MRILVIPSRYPDAAEPLNGSFFREQALMVAGAGHEVTVLVPSWCPSSAGAAPRTPVSRTAR